MDWIHCNKCMTQFEPRITLHLTSCGHMFCNNCLKSGGKEVTCLVCKFPCSILKLDPDMNGEIQDYFADPDDLLKKCCEVLRFQRNHRSRLLSYLLQSTKKFYATRAELKRMTELSQSLHKQVREYQKIIKRMQLEAQNAAVPRQTSPFNVPISPSQNISPGYIQSTPTYKRPAKSTPYSQPYQSNLMTPARLIMPRSGNSSAHSQKSNNSHRISSTVFTPPTPESAGLFSSQSSTDSGVATSSSPWKSSQKNATVSQKNVLSKVSRDEAILSFFCFFLLFNLI